MRRNKNQKDHLKELSLLRKRVRATKRRRNQRLEIKRAAAVSGRIADRMVKPGKRLADRDRQGKRQCQGCRLA